MLDVLTVVSSDKHFPLDVAALMSAGLVRLVHTFRTGSECLRAFELDDTTTRRMVLIDSLLSDISPANLCDALRTAYPDTAVVLVAPRKDLEALQRAMLAGARATISRDADVAELERALERVMETTRAQEAAGRTQRASAHRSGGRGTEHPSGIVLPVVGARGGAGRSTISCALAWLSAESGVDTALVDFDLQFGDLSFLFGSGGQGQTGAESNLYVFLQELREEGCKGGTRHFGSALADNLTLYAPQAVPEKAELMSDLLPAALDALRLEHSLVVINTGAYWTLFHAELLERCDLALCVLDQTVPGVRATKLLRDLCRRLGVPPSRLLCVMNRVRREGLRATEVAQVLQVEQVRCVSDGGSELALLLDAGDAQGLFEQGPSFLAEIGLLLDEIAACSDLSLQSAASMRFSMRRSAAAGGLRGRVRTTTGAFKVLQSVSSAGQGSLRLGARGDF